MKVMIVVTHLLGTGHLARALVLARAFSAAGDEVTIVSGGMSAPHLNSENIEFIQLPPLKSDGVNFSVLLDQTDRPANKVYLAARQTTLEHTLKNKQPDVLITELYPFGRRSLKSEFHALLNAAHAQCPNRPLVCASIRDILAPPSKPAKAEETASVLADFYDTVLVHSDEHLTPLEASWPVSDRVRNKLNYTGYVAAPPSAPHPDGLGTGEILVSAGGGSVGDSLYKTALLAAELDTSRIWRLLVGGSNARQRCEELRGNAPSNTIIEPARPDFRSLLHHAAASVSMCGYNTALDVLQTGVPAVFVPFDAGGEVEQTLRARALSRLSGIEMLPERELSASRLHDAVVDTIASPKRDASHFRFDGAIETVRFVRSRVKDREMS